MIYRTQLLDIDTDDITRKVIKLKTLWERRHNDFIFYTLGPCAYMDGIKPEYQINIKVVNPMLKAEFSDMYEKVAGYLSSILNEPITLSDELAHPSFHILESNEYAFYNGGKWHIDVPQMAVGHADKEQITFTLPIKLPTGGAGIDYTEDNRTIQYLPYKEGEIIVHSGLTMHRIAPLKTCVPGELRITLQGHVIRINGKLNMFW